MYNYQKIKIFFCAQWPNLKNVSPIATAVLPAIRNIYIIECLVLLYRLFLRFMGSMMNACVSTEMPMFGNTSLIYSTTFLLPLQLTVSKISYSIILDLMFSHCKFLFNSIFHGIALHDFFQEINFLGKRFLKKRKRYLKIKKKNSGRGGKFFSEIYIRKLISIIFSSSDITTNLIFIDQ